MKNCKNAGVARQQQQLNTWNGMEKSEWLKLMKSPTPLEILSARMIPTPNISPSEMPTKPSLQICSHQNVVYERVCTMTDGNGWPPTNNGGICSETILTNLSEVENFPPLKDQLEMVLWETSNKTQLHCTIIYYKHCAYTIINYILVGAHLQ